MRKLHNFLRNSFDKKIDGTGLAVFRIFYCMVLLCEIAQIFYFRHLIYDKVPYIDEAEISFAIPIALWGISVLFIMFGCLTRFFSIFNFILTVILLGTLKSYEYHVFYAYLGVGFLLIFLPVSACLSIDRLLLKLKYSNTTFQYLPSKKVSQIYYFAPLFLAIGLIYFDSIFIKSTTYSWTHGLGMWMPSSLPMMAHLNTSFFLNQKYLMIFLGYLTIAFEAIFIFTFFRKKWRIPLFIVGVGLHVGILLVFPIPWFALAYCALYLLMLPVSFWQRMFSVKKENPSLFFYYDSECPLCVRTKMTVSHFDWFNKISFKTVQFDAQDNPFLEKIDTEVLLDDIHCVDKKGNVFSGVDTYIQVFSKIFYLYPLSILLRLPGVYHLAKSVYAYIAKNRSTERCTEENCGYNPPEIPNDNKLKLLNNYTLNDFKFHFFYFLFFYFSISQLFVIYNSPLINFGKEKISFRHTFVDNALTKVFNINSATNKALFGITSHGVFIDNYHYKGYNHIIAITYKAKDSSEIWLPIIDKKGQPSLYNYGTNWRKVSFSMNSPLIDSVKLNKGVRDFTAFWAYKNGIDLNDATFNIKVKKIVSPKNWEKDFLNKQIEKPWIEGGTIEWNNNEFKSSIKDIEKL